MFEVLTNRTYRHLFLAQVIALLGTGLATVGLGLLAFDPAGANAGAVLGTALAIKMLAYIGVAPVASALAERLPRRARGAGLSSVGRCIDPSLCDPDLGDLCTDLCSAISFRRFHPHLPGDDSRRFS